MFFLASTMLMDDGLLMLDEVHHTQPVDDDLNDLSAPQSKSPTTLPASSWREWQGLAAAPPSKRACQGTGTGLLRLRHTSSDASSQDEAGAEEAPASSVDSLDVMIDGVVEAELTCSGACSMDSCACITSTDITDSSTTSNSSDAPAQLLTCISAIPIAAGEAQPAHEEDMVAAAQQQCEAAAAAAPEQTAGPAFSDVFQRLCYFGPQDEQQAAWLQQLQDETVGRAAESPFAAFAFLPL